VCAARPIGFPSRRDPNYPRYVSQRREVLTGRDTELDAAFRVVEAAKAGSGGSVLLQGEAGIGRTSVAEVVAAQAAAAGFNAIRTRGVRAGGDLPFGTLLDVLRPVLDRAPALPPRQRAALDVVFGIDSGASPERLLLGLAALNLIEEAAQQQPVAVVVDDLHLVDPSSAEVLSFIASRLQHAAAALIATMRTGPDHDLRASAFDTVITMAPLTESAAHTLLDARAPDLPAQLKSRIVMEAFGNPLALAELSRPGVEFQTDVSRLRGSERLRDTFLAEIDHLTHKTRRALLIAAAGEGLTRSELTEALQRVGLGPADLASAERATVIHLDDVGYVFRHPLMGQSLYESTDTATLLEAHTALAEVVREPVRRAHHRAAATATWDEDVAAELDLVAQDAARRGAFREASGAWRRAAALSPTLSAQATRQVRAAEAARRAGASTDAATLLEQTRRVIDHAEEGTRHLFGRTEWVLSMTADFRGRSADELVRASRAITDRKDRVETLIWAATKCYIHQESDDTRRLIANVLRAEIGRGDDVLVDVGIVLVDTASQVDGPTVERFLARAHAADGILINCLAFAAEEAGDMPLADRIWTVGLRLFHEAGRTSDETTALCGRSSPRITTGHLSAGIADAEQSLHLSRQVDLPVVSAMALAELARGRARAGDLAGTKRALQELTEFPSAADFARVTATAAWASGIVATLEGRFDDALADYERTSVNGAVALWAGGDFAEAAIRTGKLNILQPWMSKVASVVAATNSPQLSMLLERASGQLAGDDAQALAHLERAIKLSESGGTDLDLGYAHLVLGERLRRMRSIVKARTHLRRAADLLARAGARPTAHRALNELRAAGERDPRLSLTPGEEPPALTPQELLVSRLAAQGLSNKQIADEVYLSHKTVGAHLSRSFQKLGISRRSQLAAILQVPHDRA
jgi:DNA-binding CsgD family transcriptional regulator